MTLNDALLLFDIDGTLFSAAGAGMRALEKSGKELFGEKFSSRGVDYSGRLDPLIIRDALLASGLDHTPRHVGMIRERYFQHLKAELSLRSGSLRLPGVIELLDVLRHEHSWATLGVLTGNFAEAGRLKLELGGIDPDRFAISVWGDESPHDPPARDDLPPIALARFAEKMGRPIALERAVVIGDTKHDVRCAKASGIRCLAVATGRSTHAELVAAGADMVLSDLCQTQRVVEFLLGKS